MTETERMFIEEVAQGLAPCRANSRTVVTAVAAEAVPGLRLMTQLLAGRIAELEAVICDETATRPARLYAAGTAEYLRRFLTDVIGPLWPAWAQEEAPGRPLTEEQASRPGTADRLSARLNPQEPFTEGKAS